MGNYNLNPVSYTGQPMSSFDFRPAQKRVTPEMFVTLCVPLQLCRAFLIGTKGTMLLSILKFKIHSMTISMTISYHIYDNEA